MQSVKHDPPKLSYSIQEACRATSLGRTTLYAHIAAGRLRTVKIGGRTVILADDLNAFLRGQPLGEAQGMRGRLKHALLALLDLLPGSITRLIIFHLLSDD